MRGAHIVGPRHAIFLSKLVGWLVYPIMAFASVTSTFTRESLLANWWIPAGELAIMLFGGLVALFSGSFLKFPSSRTLGTFGFNMAIGNYVFLPLPLALFLWGEEAAAYIVVGSLGAEIAFWTIGVAFLCGRFDWRSFFNPAVMSLLLAFFVVGLDNPTLLSAVTAADFVLLKIGYLAIPLAMFLLGFHLAGAVGSRLLSREVIWVTLFRALIVPAVVISILHLLSLPPHLSRTLALVSTMPVAVASVYMSDLFGGDPEYAAKCVLVGHLLSLITVPLWMMASAF